MIGKGLLRFFPALSGSRPERGRIRLGVILVLFLLTLFLAHRASTLANPLEIFLDPLALAIPAAVGLLLLLRWPGLGLLALVFASMIIPFKIGTGTQTGINIAVLLVIGLFGLWVFEGVALRRPDWLHLSRPQLPFVLLAAVATISFLVGQLPWFPFSTRASLLAQVGGLAIFWVAAGIFVLVGNQVRDLRWLRWMVWLFLALSAVYMVGQILGQLIPFFKTASEAVIDRGVFSSSMFYLWVVALAASQAAYNVHLAKPVRVLLGALVAAAIFVALVLYSDWTSGWLPAGAVIAVMLVVSRSRWSFLAGLIGLISIGLKWDSIQRLLYSGDNPYSLMTRVEAWRIIWELVKVNPLLGLGPANYYWYTPLYPILGYRVQFNSHNNYVDLVAQVGIIGLLVFVWLVIEIARLGWGLLERVPAGFPRAYVIGGLSGLAGMAVAGMLGDWFLPFIYNVGLNGFRPAILGWAFLGGLVALERMVKTGDWGRGNPQEEALP